MPPGVSSRERLGEQAGDDEVVDAVAVEVARGGGVESGLVLFVDPRDPEPAGSEVVKVDRYRVGLAEHDVSDPDVESVARVGKVGAHDHIGSSVGVDIAGGLDRLAEEIAVGAALGARPATVGAPIRVYPSPPSRSKSTTPGSARPQTT
jgi:hypothetical protein